MADTTTQPQTATCRSTAAAAAAQCFNTKDITTSDTIPRYQSAICIRFYMQCPAAGSPAIAAAAFCCHWPLPPGGPLPAAQLARAERSRCMLLRCCCRCHPRSLLCTHHRPSIDQSNIKRSCSRQASPEVSAPWHRVTTRHEHGTCSCSCCAAAMRCVDSGIKFGHASTATGQQWKCHTPT
jgi:hypothetical protein